MGNIQTCEGRKFSPSVMCDIGQYIVSTKSTASTSSSDSMILFSKLRHIDCGGVKISPSVVMKVYLDPSKKNLSLNTSKNLDYESQVYQCVVGPMIQYQINPHFDHQT